MEIKEFQDYIRKMRNENMPPPREIIERALFDSPYYNKSSEFYVENVDEVLYELRRLSWELFLNYEEDFNVKVTNKLVQSDEDIQQSSTRNPGEIIGRFLAQYNNHLFELSKSNTNSRRARAGKEFEIIIEKILLHIGISADDQGRIGKGIFKEVGLGKLVDCVVPGVVEYNIERRRCALISMKTSLRERWQEVPEELKRTGASEMFLLTLDEGISENTIKSLNSHNITLVVPNRLKDDLYSQYYSVYGLTYFLEELRKINNQWMTREDLPKKYYEQKVETIDLYLEDSIDDYEKRYYSHLRRIYSSKI